MYDFSRLESLMYDCRMNLWWTDEETYEFIDLREAKVVKLVDNEITLYDEKEKLYWSYDIDVLEAKLEHLKDVHEQKLRIAFKKLREE